MEHFPEVAMDIAKYFENTYLGKVLPDQSRRTPMFPIRVWSLFSRIKSHLARTNNSVEGWHDAFASMIVCSHPSLSKFSALLQREQSVREAIFTKWEAGNRKNQSRASKIRDTRI